MRAAIYARGGCRRWGAALRPPEYRLSVLTSLCVGIFAAIIVGAPSFAADAVDAYIAPARLVVPIVGPLIPSSLVYQLIPDGGAPAGVMLILGSLVLHMYGKGVNRS
jgi:hypothetical protein